MTFVKRAREKARIITLVGHLADDFWGEEQADRLCDAPDGRNSGLCSRDVEKSWRCAYH